MSNVTLENMDNHELSNYVENNLLASPLELLLAKRLSAVISEEAKLAIVQQEKNKRLIEVAREFSERFLDMFDDTES